ncbi:hypothetical protein [Meiothermus rufus]|uniref:hypothetical protein n=1 Tax=Meiothermus rufus TaxID=604332 RepID=UPI000481C95E|nr:hypothetical protein [Meiothermus rufus]
MPLEVRPIGFDPAQHPLRFLLASGGEIKERPEELAQEIGEGLTPKDELIVEVRTDGQKNEWRKLASLPVEVRVRLEGWTGPRGAFVRTHPPGLALRARVFAGERLIREEVLPTEPEGSLLVRPTLMPLRIEADGFDASLSFTLMPQGWPGEWWRQGLGLGGSLA